MTQMQVFAIDEEQAQAHIDEQLLLQDQVMPRKKSNKSINFQKTWFLCCRSHKHSTKKKRSIWIRVMLMLIFAVLLDVFIRIVSSSSSNCVIKSKSNDANDFMTFGDYKTNPIVIMGDSSVQDAFDAKIKGWGSLLSNDLQYQADVFQRGKCGYNSMFWTDYTISLLGSFHVEPHAIIISIGQDEMDQPADAYGTNIRQIIHLIRTIYPSIEIILITPRPYPQEDKSMEYTWTLRNQIVTISQQTQVRLVDSWQLFISNGSSTTEFKNQNAIVDDNVFVKIESKIYYSEFANEKQKNTIIDLLNL